MINAKNKLSYVIKFNSMTQRVSDDVKYQIYDQSKQMATNL